MFDVTKLGGSVLTTGGPRGRISPLSSPHTHCSIALRGEEEMLECSYIMANALRPCAVSAGRWCVAQHSRANGQIEQGGDWRRVEVCGETRDGPRSHRSARGDGGGNRGRFG